MLTARALLIAAVLSAYAVAAGRPAPAAATPAGVTFVVNWFLDDHDATSLDGLCLSSLLGKCTLRAAVEQANATPGHDTILLGAGFYVLDRPGEEDYSLSGDLDIRDDLTIRGAGMHSTTIVMESDTTHERVLHILTGAVRLEALGLTGGDSKYAGGGIANASTLTLDYTAVFSNEAFYQGGSAAGGLYNTGLLTLTNSLVEYNEARVGGGGLLNEGVAWIENSTFAYNSSRDSSGGGISNAASLYLVNTTISRNDSQSGGSGLQNGSTGTTNAYNLTLTANIANTDSSSGVNDAGLNNSPGGVVNLRNSIVARNYDLTLSIPYYDDCAGTLGVYGNVYFSRLGLSGAPFEAPCPFSIGSDSNAFVNIGAGELLPLAYNGGPTPTHDLDPSSDAYDGADPILGCLGPAGSLATDQRGVPRVAGVRCDAGAVEHGSYWWLFAPLVLR